MSSPEHAAATAVAAARRCESCNMYATCSNHTQPAPPKSRPVHTGFMFSSMPRHAAPLPSSPKNHPPCTTTSHASGSQAQPSQPAPARHSKQALTTTALTDACSTPPKTCSVKPVRVCQRKAQHTAGIQAVQWRAAATGAQQHSLARPVDTTHPHQNHTHTQPPANKCCVLGSRAAPPSPGRLERPLPRWAATPAWLCAACQPLAR